MLSPCHHDFAAHFTAPAAEKKPATAPKVHLREGQKRFGHLPLRRRNDRDGDVCCHGKKRVDFNVSLISK